MSKNDKNKGLGVFYFMHFTVPIVKCSFFKFFFIGFKTSALLWAKKKKKKATLGIVKCI